MTTIEGYEFVALLHQNANSAIYRAVCQTDNRPTIVKLLKNNAPAPETLARIKNDYDITQSLNIPGILTSRSFGQSSDGRWFIAMDDFEGQFLAELSLNGQLDLPSFVNVAIQLVDILGQLHQAQVIHKSLAPSSILLNSSTRTVKLTDFTLATKLTQETVAFHALPGLDGHLAYISPEQTGRMNRAVDYRSDFYSLGVVLYELLTGHLPFIPADDDVSKLIHSHIARQPIAPHRLDAKHPVTLSQIILKLLAKDVEDRYQSAFGLKHDLETYLAQLNTVFDLGQKDVSDRLQIPQTLYGREQETKTLLEIFERISHTHQPELVMVAGYSGVGKTALVRELYKPITAHHGYFISGKYDQFQRDVPYSAITQAFEQFCKYALSEPTAKLTALKDNILKAVGANGQVLIEVVPALARLIGPQPAVAQASGTEAQHRFSYTFQQFVKAISRPEHPLVLFLDDLQWTDFASLNLLQTLMANIEEDHHLLIIGAYRDNEVSEKHPLMLTLQAIHELGKTYRTIQVNNLSLEAVNALVADTVARALDHPAALEYAYPLTETIHDITHGNAFFTVELLTSLPHDRLLTFNQQRRVWEWHLVDIQTQHMSLDVLALMTQKITQLPPTAQQMLTLAACVGEEFDLQTLATISQQPAFDTLAQIWPAVSERMLIAVDDAYKLVTAENDVAHRVVFHFVHDRVQQAAYDLLSANEQEAVHLRIGNLLLASLSPDAQTQRIFDLVNHLNAGSRLIEERDESLILAGLNLQAGQQAMAAAAYSSGLDYLSIGIALLPADAWQTHYDLTLSLHTQGAKAAYFYGDFVQMATWIEAGLAHATDVLERITLIDVQIQAKLAQTAYQGAIEFGVQALRELGVGLPTKPGQVHALLELAQTWITLRGKQPEDLAQLPPMTDPKQLAQIEIMVSIIPAAVIALPNLVPVVICRVVRSSVVYGNTSASALGYVLYGFIAAAILNNIETGYRFGKLSLALSQQATYSTYRAKVLFSFSYFIQHWRESFRETARSFIQAYQICLEDGDLEYATYTVISRCSNLYWAGEQLHVLETEMAQFYEVLQNLQQKYSIDSHLLFWQSVLNLRSDTAKPYQLEGPRFHEAEGRPLFERTNNQTALLDFYSHKVMLCYLFEQFSRAVECIDLAETYLEAGVGTAVVPMVMFYGAMARLAHYPNLSAGEQKTVLRKVRAVQKKMKHWARHAPMNFLHKWHLIEAERYRVSGTPDQARTHYDHAIALANEHHYWQDKAIAYELAAKFYQTIQQNQDTADSYLRKAYECYQHWGARAKVNQMRAKYQQLAQLDPDEDTASKAAMLKQNGSSGRLDNNLDVISLMKASQAIASEIEPDKLLYTIMQIVIENAGAERGVLTLRQASMDDQWVIKAEVSIGEEQPILRTIYLDLNEPAEDKSTTSVPMGVISYVLRSHTEFVSDQATSDEQFGHDPYIAAQQTQSLLCLPLLNQGRLVGALYLENNLASGAFTTDRLTVLKMLMGQAAIAIENATLYTTLQISEQKYRAIFEDSADVIFVANPTGQIIDINPACLSLLGYPRAEALQMNLSDFHLSLEGYQQFEQALKNQRVLKDFDIQLSHKDGTLLECVATANLRLGGDGVILGYQGIIRDVSVQKQAERKQQVILAQQNLIRELSTPIIPITKGVIVLPLVGSIDTERAQDIIQTVLGGITQHKARVIIIDITGVLLVDSDVARLLDKTIQAARLKGAHTIITGISDHVAETIVDLGIDWSTIETLSNLQKGLESALKRR